MTPKREAYLEKCSYREAWLRSAIVATKRDISYQKQRISNATDEWIATGAKCELWHEKQLLMTLRHELARLKGMDRVVVWNTRFEPVKRGKWVKHCEIVQGLSGCGGSASVVEYEKDFLMCSECTEIVEYASNFCPNCGTKMDGD